MSPGSDHPHFGLDGNLVAILAFVLAIILANQAPLLLGVLGGLVFTGWVLVRLGVFDRSEDSADDGSAAAQTPLETLQTRYARGEIDEAEFERRLDRLMESTDAVDTARADSSRSAGVGSERRDRPGPDTEMESERT